MSYGLRWLSIIFIKDYGGHFIARGIMNQFCFQTVNLGMVISFLQFIDQSVADFEVFSFKHLVLLLCSWVWLILEDSGNLCLLTLDIFGSWVVKGRDRFIFGFFEINLPDSFSCRADE